MAVEAGRHNFFPPHILRNRGVILSGFRSNGNMYSTPIGYGVVAPLSGTTLTAAEMVVPAYGSMINETLPAKYAALESIPVTRKRCRDDSYPSLPSTVVQNQNQNSRCSSFTFLGDDISFQIHQQSLEIDRFIAHHAEKVRAGIEERRRRYSLSMVKAIEEEIMKKLKAKEEEIEKIGKLNLALEERVRSLCAENQIWRDLAQTNEATANALRGNLEQIVSQVNHDDRRHQPSWREEERMAALDFTDDAQSCCASNLDGIVGEMKCRSCGKDESSVLLLPCRHLCLCTNCGTSLQTCPICNSLVTASIHINLSNDYINS